MWLLPDGRIRVLISNERVGPNFVKKRPELLTSDGLREFIVHHGGRLRFRPLLDEAGRLQWEMRGRYPDGVEQPVYDKGNIRIIRTARGVVAYHRLYHPDQLEVMVPLLPDSAGTLL